MSNENVMEFYETLGFEETEVDDGFTALFFELAPEGIYALITDEDGAIPQSLKQSVILACYSPEGAFLWSTSFKNSYLFKDCWSEAPAPELKLDALLKYRESSGYYQ